MSRPARIARAVTGRVGTTVVTGLMLFALFFGAGNLIFPPVLGASAGIELPAVMAGFLMTGVLLPLVAVIAVSTSGEGILGLARRAGRRFGAVAPPYAIPRVVTVAYELATRPVLELAGADPGRWALLAHVAGFLAVSVLIALRPSRMADRIGRWLTPALLALITVLCVATMMRADVIDRAATGPYAASPFSTGLTQGYLTMDVLAATVFGIVVIQTLRSRGIDSIGGIVRGTAGAGVIAAACLAAVYVGLAMIGARTDGTADANGGVQRPGIRGHHCFRGDRHPGLPDDEHRSPIRLGRLRLRDSSQSELPAPPRHRGRMRLRPVQPGSGGHHHDRLASDAAALPHHHRSRGGGHH